MIVFSTKWREKMRLFPYGADIGGLVIDVTAIDPGNLRGGRRGRCVQGDVCRALFLRKTFPLFLSFKMNLMRVQSLSWHISARLSQENGDQKTFLGSSAHLSVEIPELLRGGPVDMRADESHSDKPGGDVERLVALQELDRPCGEAVVRVVLGGVDDTRRVLAAEA